MTIVSADLIIGLIDALKRGDENSAISLLTDPTANDLTFQAMVRIAAFHSAPTPFYYRKVLNAWSARRRPPLKPAPREIALELLSDCTIDGLVPYLELFCAAYGLSPRITIAPFDSVEQIALASEARSDCDLTLVLLSDYWLIKHIGFSTTTNDRVDEAKGAIRLVVDGLLQRRKGQIILSNFSFGSWPAPGSSIASAEIVGHSAAISGINSFLSTLAAPRVHILDAALASYFAGGAPVSPRLGYLRTRTFNEERGLVQLAREAVSGIAQLFGRAHRALLTDWDNTLWGGEVGEVGVHQIVCGQETPDSLGYYLLQSYLVALNEMGVILAAVSRNDPAIARVLDENTDLALRRKHFSSLALSWGNKSESVGQIQADLNFGTDLMLYLDDNPVDLAEVVTQHPFLDIVLAGPSPDLTLTRLSSGRYFNALNLTRDDVQRAQAASAVVEQTRQMRAAADPAAFLESLAISVSVSPVTENNSIRVLQLLQKTNQFNLTTRRHGYEELAKLLTAGARVGVFSYTDKFGPQGIIGLAILTIEEKEAKIDSWAMSCRVLNRGVEEAMFGWICENASGKTISGEYIPSAKNKLVSTLLDRLGFLLVSEREGHKTYRYSYGATRATSRHLELVYESQA
jgi:FkbH-like protein